MRIGIDLGGTKIEAISLDESGRELFRKRVATPQGQYDQILQTIVALIEDVEQATGQTGSIGIGTPGALSPASGLLRNSNSVCLNGLLLQAIRDIREQPFTPSNTYPCIYPYFLRRL